MIFNRFYKVNKFIQGNGLGLSICQVITDKLKGKITLSSAINKGSGFGIVLSHSQSDDNLQQEKTPNSPVTATTDEKGNQPVVLIAEDSVSNYIVLNNIFKKLCTVIWIVN